MRNDEKEKINLIFLIILLSMFVAVIFNNAYIDELNIFKNNENSIIKDFSNKAEFINDIINEFNFFNASTNLNVLKVIDDDTVEKYDNKTFSYSKETMGGDMYFIGKLDENDKLTNEQIIDINSMIRLTESIYTIDTSRDGFKYCIYISDSDYTGIFPYERETSDNIYLRNMLANISKNFNDEMGYFKKNNTYNITSDIVYIHEYDEYLDVVCVDYQYESVNKEHGGKIYVVYESDPAAYLLENNYENYIVYSDLTTLYYDKGEVVKSSLEDIIDKEANKRALDDLRKMTKNNVNTHVFNTNLEYFKVNILNTTENIIISKVGKKMIVLNAINASKVYILSLLVAFIGFLIFLGEVNSNLKLKYLLEDLEDTNSKLKLANKIDMVTGLYNRRGILEYVDDLNKEYYIIIISIDKVKVINKLYGDAVGDRVILEVSKAIKSFFTDEIKVSRWTGKRFLILYNPKEDNKDIKSICQKLNNEIENLIVQDKKGEKVNFTVSFGISKKDYRIAGSPIIKQAEEAILYGKKEGSNSIVEYKDINVENYNS